MSNPMQPRSIQLDVMPSFHPHCIFTLQENENGCQIRFERCYSRILNDGPIVHTVDLDRETFEKGFELGKAVVTTAREDKRLILDGVSLRCTVNQQGTTAFHEFRCPENETQELRLVTFLFEIAEQWTDDQQIVEYLELIEGYFFSKLPVKAFDENPYRIRIYGAWSIDEFEGLKQVLLEAATHDPVVIDMRNFDRIGTALYPCLDPLLTAKNVSFLANDAALQCLIDIGIDDRTIHQTIKNDLAPKIAPEAAADHRRIEAVIEKQLTTWFLQSSGKSEDQITGDERFTLFARLPLSRQEEIMRLCSVPEWESPVFYLQVDENSYLLNTTQRFIQFAFGRVESLDYREFRGFVDLPAFPAFDRSKPKDPDPIKKPIAIQLRTTDERTITWNIPNDNAGFQFWILTEKCALVGKKSKLGFW